MNFNNIIKFLQERIHKIYPHLKTTLIKKKCYYGWLNEEKNLIQKKKKYDFNLIRVFNDQ